MFAGIKKIITALLNGLRDHHLPDGSPVSADHGKILSAGTVITCMAVWIFKNIRSPSFVDTGEMMTWLIASCLGITGGTSAIKTILKNKGVSDDSNSQPG